MDLISIRRKYINKRNSIIIAFLLVLLIMFIIVIREINRNKKIQEFYVSYEDQIEHVKGDNVQRGGDDSLFATADGNVVFHERMNRKFISVTPSKAE